MQDYHNVRAWHRAHVLAINVRRATQRMPRSGYGDLKTQLTSAAESIPMNIVEGCSATTQKEFARFLGISIRSASELQYQLELAYGFSVMAHHVWSKLTREVIEVRKMICGYRGSVLRADAESRARSRSEKIDTQPGGESRNSAAEP